MATVAAVATAAIAAAAVATADPSSVPDLAVTRLDSGLTVATEVVPGALSVAAGVWVAVGSRDEPERLSGVSHFLEHLLFKGTERRTAQEISRSVDARGGDFNAFTSREYTAYYCRLPARHAEFCIDLLGDVLTAPALRDADVLGERQVILEELAMDDDVPDEVAHREFARRLFEGHALGRDPAGDREHVVAITPDDVRSFFDAHYRAETMVVSLAGPVSHDEMLGYVERAFAAVRAGGGRPLRTAPGPVGEPLSIDDDTEQVHIVMGGRALPRCDDRREALDVVNHVLGGGLSSRLFEEIRERRGLAYSVYSGVTAFDDAGVFQLYAGTQPEHADEVEALMRAELERLGSGGVTDDELEIAKGYLTGAFEMGLEDTGARAARAGGLLVTTGEVRSVDDQLARWSAVDHDAVADVIDAVLQQAPLVVRLGPQD